MAAKAASWLYEKKSLKRTRLGAPDVYPQEAKQREDELTAVNVKQGFLGTPTIADEYGSARNANLTSNKFGAFFSALLAKKQDLCTFQDTNKRKPLINPKDSLWLVTPRNKPQVDAWFRDLSSGAKPLSTLGRKVPIFLKKEEVLQQLIENSVPMFRAAFYVKAFVAASSASNDSGTKGKKRQAADPSQDWSSALAKGLKDVYSKIHDCGSSSIPNTLHGQWNYLTRFARHMFEEQLLDKNDFLSWLLDLFEKTKPEENGLRLIAPLLLTYSEDFSEHEVLSRRLAYHCSKRLSALLSDPSSNETDVPEKKDSIEDLMSCPHHRSVTLIYSAIIQVITLKCKTALVWHPHNDSKHLSASLTGSPLDHLPVPPSTLPMAKVLDEERVRADLREAEEEIRLRSIAVENKWASDRWQSSEGSPTTRLLSTLDTLDKHCFDKIDSNSSMDILYGKIFTPLTRGSDEVVETDVLQDTLSQDEAKVRLLCEWAVTHKRSGEHRSMVVSRLLERRQNELTLEKDTETGDEKETEGLPFPVFQSILLNFLDTQAPILEEKGSHRLESRIAFSNLVLLFSELIRCEVFSHDQYMCTLISRGLFADQDNRSSSSTSDMKSSVGSQGAFLSGFNPHPTSHSSSTSAAGQDSLQRNPSESSLPMFDPVDTVASTPHQGLSWDMTPQMDMDDARIDADLDKLLQNIKEGQQNNNHDQDILLPDTVSPDKNEDGTAASIDALKSAAQRHLLYTTHFPLVQDESTLHECNQRLVLLYGVGKTRDEARHLVKKVLKEILKLFSRKASMDISEGGKVKKSAVKDGFNFESALTRFQSLSFFDQHYVTATCASTCIEMLNAVGSGSGSYLPLVESIAFLFDLMDMALNVHGMIEFIIQMLKELVDVDIQLQHKFPMLAGNYSSCIGLYIVGVLFRFQPCLLVSQDNTFAVFEGCLKLVKHVVNPADCSSAERCILGYIFDLYSSCSILHAKYHDSLMPLLAKIKSVIYCQIQPSALTLIWNTNYMSEYISNPKTMMDPTIFKQLNENAHCRYSFVCSAIKAVTTTRDANLLNELSILCAELSARCPPLSGDWIGLLKALCCSSNHACGFMDALTNINVNDHSIHDNVAIFTSILVARRCFSLQDFVIHCALPSLLAACPQGGGDLEAESGARLTCHLLLCLFRTSELPLSSATVTSTPATTLYSLTSPGPANLTPNINRPSYIIKHPCDRYLLAAAHSCMRVEAVIAVLKAILVLGDANTDSQKSDVQLNDLLNPMDDDDDFPDFGPLFGNRSSRQENLENAGLGEFAKLALKQICSQDWVHEKCLRDREMLCKQDLLLDTMLTSKQAQQLLDMICHPKGSGPSILGSDHDQKQYVTQILQNLDEWTLRISWLQLQLIYAQCSTSSGSSEVHNWLENLAKAIIDFFQSCSEETFRGSHPAPPAPTSSKGSKNHQNKQKAPPAESLEVKEYRVWLVAPLVSRLPNALQGKILRVAGSHVLESGNWMTPIPAPGSYSSSKSKDRFNQPKTQNTASVLLSYPPFLSLVLMCLKGQDEQRESLLKSLFAQLEQAHSERPTDDLKTRQTIHDGLQLRLSLVGSMFDMIQKSNQVLTEWSICFLALISSGIVDPQLNYELFTTVLDMLSVLIHSTLSSESTESREEGKKHYQNLMKKLRKELNSEKCNFSINAVKQLVPSSKNVISVITCEPMGSLIDTKGNKIAGFHSIDKKQGLQVADKIWINPWELLEGQKNPSPLCWSWFGVVRYERKALRCEEAVNSLQWHSHSMKKPTSYFLEAPPLPPEEVDPVPAPVVAPAPPIPVSLPPPEVKAAPQMIPQMPYTLHVPDEGMKREAGTPTEMMSPRPAAKVARQPRQPRKKRGAKNQSPLTASGQSTPPVRGMSTPPFDAYSMNQGVQQQQQPQQPPPQQQTNWGYNQNNMVSGVMNQPQQQPVQQFNQGPHYAPHPGQQMQVPPPQAVPQAPRFERRGTPGKEALNTMLRARHPPPQFMQPPQSNAVGNIPPGQPLFNARGNIMAPNQRTVRPTAMSQPQQGMQQMNHPQGQMQPQQTINQRMVMQGNQGMYGQMQGPNQMQQQMPQTGPAGGGGYGHPSNMGYQNQMQMQQDNSMHSMDQHQGNVMNQGYIPHQQQPPQVQQRGMRPQMQQPQHLQQQQFMQRQQFNPNPNVTMGQPHASTGFNQQQIPPQMTPQVPQQQIRGQMLQRQLTGQGQQQQMNPYQGQGHF